jgi:cytochrome c peroxidase
VAASPAPNDGGIPDVVTTPEAALCVDGKALDYPPGPYDVSLTATLPPDLSFDGPDGAVHIKDYFEPCAAKSRLLVIRTSAAWCGPCIWHAEHTKGMLDEPGFGGRIVLLDLLVADEDNMPAATASAARWKARVDRPGKVAVDVKYTFAKALLSQSPLPEYVFVDTKTMTVRTSAANDPPQTIRNKIALELAQLDGDPRPVPPSAKLIDELFTEDQADMIRAMALVAAPPPDPTNEFADVASAAEFGNKLFSDKQLSPSGKVACVTCHDPALSFGDGAAQSTGIEKVDRNAPSVAFSSHARWQFWDGRADTLWMQALGPPESDKEVGGSRLFIAHQIATRYAAEYGAIFGGKYPLPAELETDPVRFPASGKPGDAAWQAMTQADRDAITRIYVNVGKSIAAFERTIRVKPNALDAYAGGDVGALTPLQKKALQSFFVAGCAQCHWGPRLTDDAFHVLRFPTGRQDGKPDRGRIDVLAGLAGAEFVATSTWSDAPQASKPLAFEGPPPPSMLGAFKTPPLRGIATSAPYGHGGSIATLVDISKHYGTRAKDVTDARAVGSIEAWVPEFDSNAQAEIVRIFDVMGADPLP